MNYKQLVKDAWKTAWKYKRFAWVGLIRVVVFILGYNYYSLGQMFPQMEVPSILQTSFRGEILSLLMRNTIPGITVDFSTFHLIFAAFLYLIIILLNAYFDSAIFQLLKIIWQKEEPTFPVVLKHAFRAFPSILGLNAIYHIFRLVSDISSDYLSVLAYNPPWAYEKFSTLLLVGLITSLCIAVLMLLLVIPAKVFAVLENQRPLDAIIRTWNVFIKANFWKTVLTLLITITVEYLVIGAFMLINLPYGILYYFTRYSHLLVTAESGHLLFLQLAVASIPVGVLGYSLRAMFSNGIWVGYYYRLMDEKSNQPTPEHPVQ